MDKTSKCTGEEGISLGVCCGMVQGPMRSTATVFQGCG
jgi:hypothetical protein